MLASARVPRGLASLGLLLAACAADPSPVAGPAAVDSAGPRSQAAAAVATAEAPAETCLLGRFEVQVQQRMIEDNGVTALLEDQQIGAVPLLFAAQKRALEAGPAGAPPPGPGSSPQAPAPRGSALMLVRGTLVTEALTDLEYVDNGNAKPVETTMRRKQYTYFLAEAAWDCAPVAAGIEALGLPKGQVSAAACVPDALRKGCVPIEVSPGG